MRKRNEQTETDVTTATYDGERVELTPRFIAALKELMAAECEMMTLAQPDYADCWVAGRCYVGDLALRTAFEFEYGNESGFDDEAEVFVVLTGTTEEPKP